MIGRCTLLHLHSLKNSYLDQIVVASRGVPPKNCEGGKKTSMTPWSTPDAGKTHLGKLGMGVAERAMTPQQWPKLRLRFAKLVRIFVANATFFFAFGRIKGSFWTFELALVTNEVPLRIENGQLAPGLPLSMGMPIASGSLPVSRLADDCNKLRWHVTEFLPKACDTQADWGPEHHLCMTVQKCAPKKDPKRLCVTSTTEAFAIWVVENNREAWPAQWAAKVEHSN